MVLLTVVVKVEFPWTTFSKEIQAIQGFQGLFLTHFLYCRCSRKETITNVASEIFRQSRGLQIDNKVCVFYSAPIAEPMRQQVSLWKCLNVCMGDIQFKIKGCDIRPLPSIYLICIDSFVFLNQFYIGRVRPAGKGEFCSI